MRPLILYIDPETIRTVFGGPLAPLLGWLVTALLAAVWPVRYLYHWIKPKYAALSRPVRIGVILMIALGAGSLGATIWSWLGGGEKAQPAVKAAPAIPTPYDGVIVLGMDGLDPQIVEKM